MKVKFLKDHLDNKVGDVVDVSDERGNYWISASVVELDKEPKKETKEFKGKLDTK